MYYGRDVIGDYVWSRMVAVRPRVSFAPNQLIIKSDWRTLLWSLFAWNRRIVVDQKARNLKIFQRTFWFFVKERYVEFDWVGQISCTYRDQSMTPGWSHRSMDMYTISLLLKDGEVVNLCKFFGEGLFVNAGYFPDWWYWQQAWEDRMTAVDQSGASSSLASMLSNMIGVPNDCPLTPPGGMPVPPPGGPIPPPGMGGYY